jgi:hypothetical protein
LQKECFSLGWFVRLLFSFQLNFLRFHILFFINL